MPSVDSQLNEVDIDKGKWSQPENQGLHNLW